MKSNRELDALVAEKVMGEEKPDITHDYLHVWEALPSEGGAWYCVLEYDKGDVCTWHPKPFSTYMGAAMQVVEKMNLDGYYVEINHDLCAWSVVFVHADTMTRHTADWKQSFQEQVCKAALKAVGYEHRT